jgi:hypothetical protein
MIVIAMAAALVRTAQARRVFVSVTAIACHVLSGFKEVVLGAHGSRS